MVNIGGTDYEVKALTVRQVREAQKLEDQSEIEISALALATGCDRETVAAWYDAHPAGVVFKVVAAMWEATNATEEARFQNVPGDDAGVERAGV
jgi:hypothetical protein